MNIVLFDRSEVSSPLSREDPRARHILGVLRRAPGESLDVGLINGPRGRAVVEEVSETELRLSFAWQETEPARELISLIVGLCRPQSSRRILREAATLGVAEMFFVRTDRGEPSYADSHLWSTGEYERHVRAGVEQAFATRVPSIQVGMTLTEALTASRGRVGVALDNYESTVLLHRLPLPADEPLVLAVGSERGWTSTERGQLRAAGYQLAGLGDRVLRTETAVIAGLTLMRAATGIY